MDRPLAQLVDRGRRGSDHFLEKRGLVPRGGQGSGDGLGVLDMDVDMDDVGALKASELCEEDSAEKNKKKTDGHFELTSLKETLQGTLGLRHKKDSSSQQQPGGNRAHPSSHSHANSSATGENATNSQDKASSNKPQSPIDAAKTD
ncbi:hypothetical protein EPH_0012280 [Eimeria praecox]|uniref:Uncharacterized protein n=1 Tax=Eimeria praecox TaxID=51316 RepID=U6H0F0_9EIME|nr:hypothetical protein EPH_0012280 [Eimeria praecox]